MLDSSAFADSAFVAVGYYGEVGSYDGQAILAEINEHLAPLPYYIKSQLELPTIVSSFKNIGKIISFLQELIY